MAVAAVYAEEFEVALLKLAVYAVGQCLWIWIEPLMVFKVLLYAGPAEPFGRRQHIEVELCHHNLYAAGGERVDAGLIG